VFTVLHIFNIRPTFYIHYFKIHLFYYKKVSTYFKTHLQDINTMDGKKSCECRVCAVQFLWS
jgi:hypothetical protein